MAIRLTEEQIARIKFLENDRGQLTATVVLEDARQPASPLHGLFEWDPAKAAARWHLMQAREIIRTVTVNISIRETTIRAPFYTRDPDAVGQGYRSVTALQRDPASAREALITELNRAAGNVERARHLAVVLNLDDEIEALLDRIVGLQHRVEKEVAETEEARPS